MRLLLSVFVLPVALALAGCAGMAQGVKSSTYREPIADPVEQASTKAANALVIIRYPALIHAEAENIYVSSFASKAIGGEVPFSRHSNPQTFRIANDVIAKSSYFAMSLYRELRDALPEGSVLLSPHMIDWNRDEGFHSRPILASEQVPTVLTVDFNVYSYPDVNELMESPPVTFGDLVTPLLVVRTSPWGQPALNGLLIVSEPLTGTAWRQGQARIRSDTGARLSEQTQTGHMSLTFIEYLNERGLSDPSLPLRNTTDLDSARLAVEHYPLEKIQLDGALVAALDDDDGSGRIPADPLSVKFARGAAGRLIRMLDGIDHDRATFFARQSAFARFDPEVARVLFTRPDDESVRARLQLAEALVAAEREFLSAQSDSIYAGSYEGDYGVRMRRIIAAEYRMLEERRRLARAQNISSAIAALALAGSVYAATVTTTASTAAVAAFSGVSLMGSVWAVNRALDASQKSEEINEYFIARMAQSFEREMAVQMEWLESKEIITARGFAEFRNKTLTLYQSRVRSLAVGVDDHCAFRHPDFAAGGIWIGACDDGLSEGNGYGLILDENGPVVEYLGQTSEGLASGRGAMILHRDPVEFLEGKFGNGRPDGEVRVERPGVEPRVRRYRDGRDVGKGNADRWEPLGFAHAGGAR